MTAQGLSLPTAARPLAVGLARASIGQLLPVATGCFGEG
jgi:hypothetical protein